MYHVCRQLMIFSQGAHDKVDLYVRVLRCSSRILRWVKVAARNDETMGQGGISDILSAIICTTTALFISWRFVTSSI